METGIGKDEGKREKAKGKRNKNREKAQRHKVLPSPACERGAGVRAKKVKEIINREDK